ncbi:hypothetical protein [Bacillus massiliigorillae]|uniref:hypothetical protein n=1 Tax=Bacillus massiliigorillae TaxID=1243664 RepID=UPI0003A64B8E|nr:hypothetical protein [Bacillus massiliigorillae]
MHTYTVYYVNPNKDLALEILVYEGEYEDFIELFINIILPTYGCNGMDIIQESETQIKIVGYKKRGKSKYFLVEKK